MNRYVSRKPGRPRGSSARQGKPLKGVAMQRTSRTQSWSVPDVVHAGEAVVVRSVSHGERGLVVCGAAEPLAGSLRREGLSIRYVEHASQGARATSDADTGRAVAQMFSYVGRDGRAVGLCVVTRRGTEAETARKCLDAWSAVMRTKRVTVAGADPLCPGARRAVETVEGLRASTRGPVTVLAGSVGTDVAEDLARHGAVLASADATASDSVLVVGPAGAQPTAWEDAVRRGVTVVDAVCPLVAAAQAEVRRFTEQGESVVLVGRVGHAVAAALVGPEASAVRVVEGTEDVAGVQVADPSRVAVVLQPGLPVEQAERVAEAVRDRFGHVLPQHPGTYCHAASDRVHTLAALAFSHDVVLVAGPSRTARAMASAIERTGGTAHALARPEDLLPQWLAGAASVAVASAPGAVSGQVTAVVSALEGLGPCSTVRQEFVTTALRPASPRVRKRERVQLIPVLRAEKGT